MKLLMSKIEIEQFLKKEFPQVSQSFEILTLDAGSISMLMNITNEHLRPGGSV